MYTDSRRLSSYNRARARSADDADLDHPYAHARPSVACIYVCACMCAVHERACRRSETHTYVRFTFFSHIFQLMSLLTVMLGDIFLRARAHARVRAWPRRAATIFHLSAASANSADTHTRTQRTHARTHGVTQ